MASSINASTTAGVVTTADTSGVLNIQTAGVTAISINASQAVSFTNSPTVTGGTANGVAYLNGSNVLTTGSALVFDGSNLGLGVTPSAWTSSFGIKGFNISNGALYGATNDINVLFNSFFNGTNFIYSTSAVATKYTQGPSGQHQWFNAPSGTAGNIISFTQAMTLDASGRLGIGTTSPTTPLQIQSTAATGVNSIFCTGSTTAYNFWTISNTSGNARMGVDSSSGGALATGSSAYSTVIGSSTATSLHLISNGAVGATLDTSGNLLVGTTSAGSTTGTTIRPDGVIVSKGVYNTLVSASTRSIYMDNSGYFGYISSTRDSKTNINALSDVNWLYSLNPVSFNYKKLDRETNTCLNEAEEEIQYGLIAEDTAQVNDALCFYDTTENGNELCGIAYEKLVVPMLKAIQEQQAIITQLQADVAALKGA